MTSPDRDLLYVTPIAPSDTGNGLAMRGELISAAASSDFRVKILVVPVVGPGRVLPGREISVLPLPGPRQLAAQAAALMTSATWRDRISRTYPLPWLATLAPATLAAAAEQILGPARGTPVHVARSYLAPLGIALAERIGSAWLTLDLDDDDEGLARTAGDEATGAAYGRLVAEFGPLFSAVALAAPAEATAVSARHGLTTTVLPNALTGPAASLCSGSAGPGAPIVPRSRAGHDAVELLFVGNLTYWANAEAAVRLVRDVLPHVRRLTGRTIRVTLAGDTGHDLQLKSLAREPGVRLTGFVPDVGPVYDRADMLVAPLMYASGTRIKLLEAFSRGVPVVTTAAGAAGLEVASGEHLLIADPGEMAHAVVRLAADDELRARLTARALELVRRNYSQAAVVPRIREFFATAAASAGQAAFS
jgi:glycosyltransferase involved in cell wall biosynthesis